MVSAPSSPEYSLVTRSSDRQNLLLANKLSKMRQDTPVRNCIVGADHHRVHKPAEIAKLKREGERGEDAPRVIRKIHKPDVEAHPIHRLFETKIGGKAVVVEHEPDDERRDTEQIPFQEAGEIEAFLKSEVLPYAADAWYNPAGAKVGYEISFTRYFYKPGPMRSLEEIRGDILALEQETEGVLGEILGGATA